MSERPRPLRPSVDALEPRLALSGAPVPGDAGGVVAPALQAFVDAYPSTRGQANYNPAIDANHNGQIGHTDAKPILASLAAITPRVPLRISLNLAPGQEARDPHPRNSGGVTHKRAVTVVGRTTPNSIVYLDSPLSATKGKAAGRSTAGTFAFAGPALAADSRGYFSYKVSLPDRLTNTEYLIRDPFGNQKVFTFPILRI